MKFRNYSLNTLDKIQKIRHVGTSTLRGIMSKQEMSKQEQAFAKFMEYLREADISHMVGIMRLYDAMLRLHNRDICFHSPLSIKKLSDEDAELAIAVIDKLERTSLSKRLQEMLGS